MTTKNILEQSETHIELTADEMTDVQGGWGTGAAFIGLMNAPQPTYYKVQLTDVFVSK